MLYFGWAMVALFLLAGAWWCVGVALLLLTVVWWSCHGGVAGGMAVLVAGVLVAGVLLLLVLLVAVILLVPVAPGGAAALRWQWQQPPPLTLLLSINTLILVANASLKAVAARLSFRLVVESTIVCLTLSWLPYKSKRNGDTRSLGLSEWQKVYEKSCCWPNS